MRVLLHPKYFTCPSFICFLVEEMVTGGGSSPRKTKLNKWKKRLEGDQSGCSISKRIKSQLPSSLGLVVEPRDNETEKGDDVVAQPNF